MSAFFNPGSLIAGISTGLRTLTATSVTLATGKSAWTGLVGTLAAGELLGDKLPATPERTKPIGLIGRAAFGGLCGYILAGRSDRSRPAGAVLGIAGAVAGAFAGINLRKIAGAKLGLPDPVVALVEDGIAFGLARVANA